MKSAYELALERLEQQGIEPPQAEALDPATRAEMAELRIRAKAKLAELEILYRQSREGPAAGDREEEDDNYRRERRRIEDDLEHKLEKLRRGATRH